MSWRLPIEVIACVLSVALVLVRDESESAGLLAARVARQVHIAQGALSIESEINAKKYVDLCIKLYLRGTYKAVELGAEIVLASLLERMS